MKWHSKLFSNEEINSDKYQNVISGIRSQYNKNPEKLNEFAVFKEELENNNHKLFFSPTSDEKFLSIINQDLEAEPCNKPNLNNAKLFLGRYI